MRQTRPALILLLTMVFLSGCTSGNPDFGVEVMQISWEDRSNEFNLPESIELFEGTDDDLPLKAWLARIDVNDPDVSIEVLSSQDEDGRQSVAEFVEEEGVCLAVNGGYFLERDDVFEHIGLLIADGSFEQFATPGIYKDDLRYDVHRAAVGFMSDDTPSFGWVSSSGDSAFVWAEPIPNKPEAPGVISDSTHGTHWAVEDAVSGGPMLLQDGSNRLTIDEEIFFGTTIPDVHPRTAAGVDEDGRLILLVVDGRQRVSKGVTLAQLAGILRGFNVQDALNLDGGGSSTMVASGELLNRPAGGTFQREVVSAIGVHCHG